MAGKLVFLLVGLLIGAVVGAGAYAVLVPRTTGGTWCSANQPIALTGAGATFPFPLLDKWRVVYGQQCPNVQLNYQSVGSGAGIAQITAKTVDFGASDAPLNAAQRAAAPGLLHIPETIGAVTLSYRILKAGSTTEYLPSGLNLTGTAIARIFLGNITYWDDPILAALNPQTPLPHSGIFSVHRSDGSGTTFVFTDYLSKVSADWSNVSWGPGKGTAVNWPVPPSPARSIGAKGNEGVSGVILGNANSIGYVELSYALNNRLTFGSVRNADDSAFVVPTLNTTKAAAAAISQLPAGSDSWQNVSITNAPGADSYPISSLTYLLVYKELSTLGSSMTQEKARGLVDFLWWAVHTGQDYSTALAYVPLPDNIVALDSTSIDSITFNGQVVRTG